MPDEWETLVRLTALVSGAGPNADVDAVDDMVAAELARREGVELEPSNKWRGPERLLDIMLRGGPYELTMDDLVAAPHGIDLGALEPRLPEVARTASGLVEMAPAAIAADVPRLQAALAAPPNGMVLIGRRHLRSNNSWLHNLPLLVRGPVQCTAHLNPDDAARLGVADGELVRVSSRAGSVEIAAEVTADIMPRVVSIPHGWGHDTEGAQMSVAREHAGVNSNVLTDEHDLDPISGTAVLNGIPIVVEAVGSGHEADLEAAGQQAG